MTLTKPLAILHRTCGSVSLEEADDWESSHLPDGDRKMDVDDKDIRPLQPASVGWDMVAIVKRKIIFSKRPMPVASRATI